MGRGADHLPALEEGNVYRRGIEVGKLEDEHLEGEGVLEGGLRPVHLCTCGASTQSPGMLASVQRTAISRETTPPFRVRKKSYRPDVLKKFIKGGINREQS